MKKTIVKGLVKKVENINKHFSFVTLIPTAEEKWSETRIPFYMKLGREYEGKVVDVTSKRSGFLGRIFEQTIGNSNMSSSIQISYSLIRKINEDYRILEARQKKEA